jgi:hypothetical protein
VVIVDGDKNMKKLLCNVLCIATLIGGFALADEIIKRDNKVITTVYVVHNNDSEKTIHRIFATKIAANKYVDDFKSSHDYLVEIVNLTE